jgi:hypothetical protein
VRRACDAQRNQMGRLYSRPYILNPALERHLARFDELYRTPPLVSRSFGGFPALEYDLEAVHSALGPSDASPSRNNPGYPRNQRGGVRRSILQYSSAHVRPRQRIP